MKKIVRMSITDAVVESIREMIENKEYLEGEKLPPETRLCDMLGVSRTSVREAIRVLQTMGYLENRPGKGAFVASNHVGESAQWYEVEDARFTDFMEVRMAMETSAVSLAVERASQEEIRQLEEIHRTFVEANEKKDMQMLITIDEQFHTKIIEITRNQLLININRQLLKAFRTYRTQSFTNEEAYRNAIVPHGKILECFENKDPSQAVREMRNHLEITTADMDRIHRGT